MAEAIAHTAYFGGAEVVEREQPPLSFLGKRVIARATCEFHFLVFHLHPKQSPFAAAAQVLPAHSQSSRTGAEHPAPCKLPSNHHPQTGL